MSTLSIKSTIYCQLFGHIGLIDMKEIQGVTLTGGIHMIRCMGVERGWWKGRHEAQAPSNQVKNYKQT